MRYRAALVGCILLAAAGFSHPAAGQVPRVSLSIFGGINSVGEYGTIDDYVIGENDFPVTPSHTPACIGAALGIPLFGRLGLDLDARYFLGSRISLEDPSDGDTLELDSSKHISLTANLVFKLGTGRLQPYLLAGAGIDSLTGLEEQNLISDYGYEIIMFPPEDKTDWLFNAGGGVFVWMNSRLGLRLDLRYVILPETETRPAITSLNAVAGLTLRF